MTEVARFGWNEFDGFSRFECDGACARRGVGPVHTYRHPRGCSITGGYVVRDPRLGSLYRRYVYADLCEGKIRSFVPKLRRVRGAPPTGLRLGPPVSFGEDSRSRVYVVSMNGPVYRLEPVRASRRAR